MLRQLVSPIPNYVQLSQPRRLVTAWGSELADAPTRALPNPNHVALHVALHVTVHVTLHAALHVALHVAIGPRRRQAPYSEGAIRDLFAAAICRRDEGLMVKRADSRYVPNSRLLWAKLKRVHIPGLGDSISLALIGGRLAADGAR